MRQFPWLALFLPGLLAVAGCGGRPADAPEDAALALATDSGRQALDAGHLPQAARQYQRAYDLAVARDDAVAIGTSGYNLAVVELADNDVTGSLRTVLRTRDALAARGAPAFAELDLVQSAVLHRLGRDPEADALAARAQASAGSAAVFARATYVRGLIADRRGDAAGLASVLAQFGPAATPPSGWEADRDELMARLALLQGRCRQAAMLAQQAADSHRIQLDYRAMAEDLAIAARSMQCAGSPRVGADLFRQAGESAAARGDQAAAAQWLNQAGRPTPNPTSSEPR